LTAYLRRVEDVLGKGWENHVEGQKLKADGDSFRNKLNTQELFEDWSRKVSMAFCFSVKYSLYVFLFVCCSKGKNCIKVR
jgi:dynein heavy chain 1